MLLCLELARFVKYELLPLSIVSHRDQGRRDRKVIPWWFSDFLIGPS
jgi:hypothetical protein